MEQALKEAVLWKPLEGMDVQCQLCSFRCRIKDQDKGICQVRQNQSGKLYSLNYNAVCSVAVDPIEKKPLFHFYPNSKSLSVASAGCNFRCDFCQNWQISQLPRMQKSLGGNNCEPEAIVTAAQQRGCKSISYTYTEPTVFMELCTECGSLARQKGLANVFVSNGYMTQEALEFAQEFLDGINVDLKSFSDDFYRQHCRARLQPVLQTLRYLAQKTDIWLEVTTLIVPELNDSEKEIKQIAEFIADELGKHVPWHISRFHPNYEMTDSYATPAQTMTKAYDLAKEAGLYYVYLGNMPGFGRENTFCHECGNLLIERLGYQIGKFNLINGRCSNCSTVTAGRGMNPV